MDILNEYYPLYGTNPDALSESEQSENNEYIEKLDSINKSKKRKKILTMDDFCLKYGDDMWYIWCIVHDYSHDSNLLDKLDYTTFCEMCYNNSTRY
jgi:exosome complex RNA-binding protein Rrp42 (RNase PH superfamily)